MIYYQAHKLVALRTMRLIFCFTTVLALMVPFSRPAMAVDIQEVTSPKGIKALLVEDYSVPIISLSLLFRGGSTQDPAGKEGTLRLVAAMMDEGSGTYDSAAFQARMEELGLELSFAAGRDSFSGSMRTLESESDNTFEMLRLAINEPRFDAVPFERMRTALITQHERSKNNPLTKGRKALRNALYKNHPYRRPVPGTVETLSDVERDDLSTMHKKLLARDNLFVGVVGAIDSKRLELVLDKVFGELPAHARLMKITEAAVEFGETINVEADLPQTNISLAFPGLKRDHKDFFAAHLMNHILGGGSFSSRLYEEIREKRGLAYSVRSFMSTNEYSAVLVSGTGTRSDRAAETLKVMREEIKKMADYGPTAAELEAAKKYVIGTYAISNLDTSSKIAGVLVAIQQANLGNDYIDRREGYISSVTLEDVRRVAKRLLGVKPTIVTVGPKQS